jgi:hypothetical protein
MEHAVEPMKEGRIIVGDVPDWLAPYAPSHDAVRASLTTPEVPLFDSLWERACNNEVPALSLGEQDRLIAFFGRPAVTPQGGQDDKKEQP